MYDEYVAHCKNYTRLYGAQTAVFFQVGKFYEFYDILDPLTGEGQTATKQITDLLGIKLTYKKATGLPAGRDGLREHFLLRRLQSPAGDSRRPRQPPPRLAMRRWSTWAAEACADRVGAALR